MNIINKPYPYSADLWQNLKFHLWIGLFVAFFLIVFQPFGTDTWVTEYKLWKLGGYGLLAFAVPTILFFIRNKIVDIFNFEQKYKVKHEMLWLLFVLISIALANCLYISYLHDVRLTMRLFKYGVFMVSAIGFFPIIASVMIKHNHYLALNTKEAAILDDLITAMPVSQKENNHIETVELLTLTSENGKDQLSIEPMSLLYIESLENYVNVCYLNDGSTQKKILRSSLAKIELQIPQPYIMKCHRSFIINLRHVAHFTGNAQGYQMSFEQVDDKVPVSRAFGPMVLAKMKSIHQG